MDNLTGCLGIQRFPKSHRWPWWKIRIFNGHIFTGNMIYLIWWFGWHLLFSHDYWECHHPNWRTHMFQDGVGILAHQPAMGYTSLMEVSPKSWAYPQSSSILDGIFTDFRKYDISICGRNVEKWDIHTMNIGESIWWDKWYPFDEYVWAGFLLTIEYSIDVNNQYNFKTCK